MAEKQRSGATRPLECISSLHPVTATARASTAPPGDGAEAQRHLLAYAAHELRTPLATQRALLELALADVGTDASTWREIGWDVLGACRQQERLLEACLTLARCRSGLERCQPVDLAAVVAEVLRADDPGTLERVIELAPARTVGEPSLLERLVANLVSNAIRHNIAGGRIHIATRSDPGRAVLSIANTGPPIPATALPRLFQPFRRLNASSRSFGDGVGLGLAIVHAIAEAHAATLTARAQTGGGLRIDVSFPTALDQDLHTPP